MTKHPKLNVNGTDRCFNTKAIKPHNRAESGISCREKWLFQISELHKGF